ncbi:MAG TPA: isocitrate/isopropylmalate family dehydrogenase, partial [Candidatus Omnitrophota bacterium]|nr:isocitrate/isopropylmalate family dehydrogenase [Candidatus Omnitrophota bacterium]
MTIKTIALVEGDGSGPEMMAQAARVVTEAAKKDGVGIEFVKTPMGWNAYHKFGDTLPADSYDAAVKIGLVFFGGVGDFETDRTIGAQRPEMRPEARVLLALRKRMGLLLNFRPMIYYKALASLANVKPETIPDGGIKQIWIRYLLEDSYFGNEDLLSKLSPDMAASIGMKLKKDVTGNEGL